MQKNTLQVIAILGLSVLVALELALLITRFFGIISLEQAKNEEKASQNTVVVLSPQKRIEEVQSIVAALKEYNEDRKSYPKTLQGLVPAYLSGPSDPSTGFSAYRYVPIGEPIEFYTLTYTITEDYNEQLLAGQHVASPKGLTGGEFPLSGSDLDNDGVDDAVEIYVYRTDSQNPDTDNDGFSDGVEISSGHNPRGK
ncbi:MAG: hypothetical protein H6760_00395 [Candidatus Nomurabacteria bacterium]|nr:MAG: hypothetical protein H6760_00395 [Candidatus Nomurabacteria bacterium]